MNPEPELPEALYRLSHPAIDAAYRAPVPMSTKRAHVTRGVHGVKLSAVLIGGQWRTSPERVRAFLEACNSKREPEPEPEPKA